MELELVQQLGHSHRSDAQPPAHRGQHLGGEEKVRGQGQVSEGVCSWTTKLSEGKRKILRPINYVPYIK